MEESGDHKRGRDEEEDYPEISSPEAKRLRDDFLLDDILDDDAGAGDQDLASVMKSLEEEIALPSPPPPQPQPEGVAAIDHPDLGFLFEASDDELGLPPPPPTAGLSSSDEDPEVEVAVEAGDVEGVGFGQIWGYEDEINGFDGLNGFGTRPEEWAEAEDGVVFDGGLFDYPEVVLRGPSDFADLSWRAETLPAV